MTEKSLHIPVLLHEAVDALLPEPGKFLIDGTVNGGGHAVEIIRRIQPGGKFLGFEWNKDIAEATRRRLQSHNVEIVRGNYADLARFLYEHRLPKCDGLLLDLGFSSEEIEASGRGFSFMRDEPLLMTYSDEAEPVKEILRSLKEEELANIIYELGGERFSRRIAKAIKEQGRRKKIETSGELVRAIHSVLPKSYERGRIDPATRTFQALRIYANHELENISTLLKSLPQIIAPHGRIAIISFHSLEDRLVKKAFEAMKKEGILEIITKKPLVPSRTEILRNPKSRSAKLRIAEITAPPNT